MARIELRDISHCYADSPRAESDYALKPLQLAWESGGAYALLGPSGCGKTTLLNIMSGLVRPTRGAVVIDGRDVTALPTQARNIAQVFQFPVSYDTMTVFDNLAFPLRNRGQGGAALTQRVEHIAELLELTPYLRQRARRLSADMQQRISLGRGLVRTDVAAILLDEPLTVIDPHTKWLLRRKLKQIQAELSVTLVYVTHDQVEALTLADRVVVMNDGRVLQAGTPQELFERPAHTFVGWFIGSPGMNLLQCQLEEVSVNVQGQRLDLDRERVVRARAQGTEIRLGARPELLRLAARAQPGRTLEGRVLRVEQLGHSRLVTIRIGTQSVSVRLRDEAAPPAGSETWVEFPPESTLLYADDRVVD